MPFENNKLYRIKNIESLLKILNQKDKIKITQNDIKYYSDLNKQNNIYNIDIVKKECKTNRIIQKPNKKLKLIQSTIKDILNFLPNPEYRFAVPKRGPKNLVQSQQYNKQLTTCDIKKYYPHCKYSHINNFFKNNLKCNHSIAKILTNLSVWNPKFYLEGLDNKNKIEQENLIKNICESQESHLATGSSVSPILSFWIHYDLYEAINKLATENNVKFSLYVDNLIFSGDKALEIQKLSINLIHKYYEKNINLIVHDEKLYHFNQSKEMLGLIMDTQGKISVNKKTIDKKGETEQELAELIGSEKKYKKILPVLVKINKCHAVIKNKTTKEPKKIKNTYQKNALIKTINVGDKLNDILNKTNSLCGLNRYIKYIEQPT